MPTTQTNKLIIEIEFHSNKYLAIAYINNIKTGYIPKPFNKQTTNFISTHTAGCTHDTFREAFDTAAQYPSLNSEIRINEKLKQFAKTSKTYL